MSNAPVNQRPLTLNDLIPEQNIVEAPVLPINYIQPQNGVLPRLAENVMVPGSPTRQRVQLQGGEFVHRYPPPHQQIRTCLPPPSYTGQSFMQQLEAVRGVPDRRGARNQQARATYIPPHAGPPGGVNDLVVVPWLGATPSSTPYSRRVQAHLEDPFLDHPAVLPVARTDDSDDDDFSPPPAPASAPAQVPAQTSASDSDGASTNVPGGGTDNQIQEEVTMKGNTFDDDALVEAEDDDGLNADNAQSFLSPDACVFVANLPAASGDIAIEHALHTTFHIYGRVFIKVKRDPGGMPVAFLQYTEVEDCHRAIIEGRGATILGRPCRTEQARVERTVFCSRTDGAPLSQEDTARVESLCTIYGETEPSVPATMADKMLWKIPEGIFVKFHYFQACQDALRALGPNPRYKVVTHPPAPAARLLRRNTGQAPRVAGRTAPALYVGNLPLTTTKEDLIEIFGVHGEILHVEVCMKVKSSHVETFAFVYFGGAWAAQNAVLFSKDSLVIKGRNARVDWKRSPARVPAPAHPHYGLSGQSATMGLPIVGGPQAYGWEASSQYAPRGAGLALPRPFFPAGAFAGAAAPASMW